MTMERTVWLDVARLIERVCVGSLTGIDRVELAYAEQLMAQAPERTRFVVLNRWARRFAQLPTRLTQEFLRDVRQAWTDGSASQCRVAAARLLACGAVMSTPADDRPIYLLVSHRHLERRRALEAALQHSGAAFVPMVHDLIPLEFPEYGRPGESDRHAARIHTVAALADAIVVNSAATGRALRPYLTTPRPVHVAPLAVTAVATREEEAEANDDHERPYFLCVGTIEPRKNHLLLLHVWRRLAAMLGAATPRLLIVGRRGWENENILDILDRCSTLRPHVVELGSVPDRRMVTLLRGARALLMPSFAEGFGLPVAEALARRTPVLCSDLAALREAGVDVPEYLDPLDALAWQAAVLDYATSGSSRRQAQLARMPDWRPMTWDSHIASVLKFLRDRVPDHLPRHVHSDTPFASFWHGPGLSPDHSPGIGIEG